MSRPLDNHLGDLAAALVDDQLAPATHDLAVAHLAGCLECRRQVEQERELKARLRALAEPGLPPSLLSRLSALNRMSGHPDGLGDPARLGESDRLGEPPPVEAPIAADDRRDALTVGTLPGPLTMESRGSARPSVFRDARRGRLLAGAASFVLVGIGAAYAAAADAQTATPVQPASNALTTSSTFGPAGSPMLNDPAFAAMTASYVR